MTAPLSVNANLEVTGNTCLFCTRERVLFDESNGLQIRREGGFLRNRERDKEENARAWGEFGKQMTEDPRVDYPRLVHQVTRMTPEEIQERGKSLKPDTYRKIISKAVEQGTPIVPDSIEPDSPIVLRKQDHPKSSSVRMTRLNIRKEENDGRVITATFERAVGSNGDPSKDLQTNSCHEMAHAIVEAMK